MPSLFKRTYRDRTGKMRRTSKWYGQWTDASGKVHCVPLSEHKPTAADMLARKALEASYARHGMTAPPTAAAIRDAALPLDRQLADYADYLRSRGATDKHIRTQCGRIARVVEAGGITRTDQITEHAVATGIGSLRAGYRTAGRGASLRTVGELAARAMLTACKGFTRWLHLRARRLASDPLAGATLGADSTKGRRVVQLRPRRSLTGPEFERLVAAARASEVVHRGLDGEARAMLYLTALHTGFRASELAALTPDSLSLGSTPPTITTTHGGRSAVQPVRADFAAELAAWLTANPPRTPHGRLWAGAWHEKAADMLRLDLAAAGVPHTTAEGRIDFHAIHTLLIRAVQDNSRIFYSRIFEPTIGAWTRYRNPPGAGVPPSIRACDRCARTTRRRCWR